MKKEINMFGIRCTLILALGLTLVSGYSFAQTQYAYTANSGTINVTSNSVSEILNDATTTVVTCLPKPGQAIAVSPDNVWAAVTQTNCNGSAGNECVSIVDFRCTLIIIANGCQGPSYLVYPEATVIGTTSYTAQFSAITPLIPTANMGTNQFAYVTTGSPNVFLITFTPVPNSCASTIQTTYFSLPSGSSSYGVAVANNGKQVWITDANPNGTTANANVYMVNTYDLTTVTIPLCPGGMCPSGYNTPRPTHIAYAYVNSTTYRMYITDGAANRAVWVVEATIDASGNVKGTPQVLSPITWPFPLTDACTMQVGSGFSAGTYGIAVKSDNSQAYVTSKSFNNRLFMINGIGAASSGTPTCANYTQNLFNTPLGVTWLSNGKAYVGNANATQVNIIQTNPSLTMGLITVPGNPSWIATRIVSGSAPSR